MAKSVKPAMTLKLRLGVASLVWVTVGILAICGPPDGVQPGEEIPTGKAVTPTAATGSVFLDLNPRNPAAPAVPAGQAAALAVSPDGKALAILTSGYNVYRGADGNINRSLSTEYVFLFDITERKPKQVQVLPLPHAFQGLAWGPLSDRLFASGGKDDKVVEFVRKGFGLSLGRTFLLGHNSCLGVTLHANCGAEVAGLAVSPDGTRLLIANLQNDSVSLVDLATGNIVEQDLRPGIIDAKRRGEPGGSFPRSVAWSSSSHAYVASERDREIVSLAIRQDRIRVVRRIPVHGQPVALLANSRGSRLYAALDNSDQAAIFDTAHDKLIESVDATAPESVYTNTKRLGGANSNALALTPDERTLLVSDGGENAIAVIHLSDRARGLEKRNNDIDGDDRLVNIEHSAIIGLVPTGWYPSGVATSKDGSTWYVINGRHTLGPGVGWCELPGDTGCIPKEWDGRKIDPRHYDDQLRPLVWSQNRFILQLEKAGFLTLEAPTAMELARLTKQVAHNNHFDRPYKTAADERLFSFLRDHIQHVIYVIKENKTYDQVLGDLEVGNGDPRLVLFGERITPNTHELSRSFVTLDNFFDSGESSWTGWDWSTAAQTNDLQQRVEPMALANLLKGEGYGLQPDDRGVNVGYATSRERQLADPSALSDPNILPGARSVFEIDGPDGEEGKGYLWDAALRGGKTVRNWGFSGGDRLLRSQPIRNPYVQQTRVFWPQTQSLMPYSDPYYRSFDNRLPDFWRVEEFRREFAQFSDVRSAPNLMLVQLGTDHMGDFAQAIDDVNTPDTQVADNDYALGRLIETVANSAFAKNTLIIALEDDPGLGLDHIDAQRSFVVFAGPYVRRRALVSTRYTTVNVVKTIEEVLGVGPMGLNDALAAPMSDIFDPGVTNWSYRAIVPGVLLTTKLPLPRANNAGVSSPRGSSEYWASAMTGQDFSAPDRIDPVSFNRALWRGLKRSEPHQWFKKKETELLEQ